MNIVCSFFPLIQERGCYNLLASFRTSSTENPSPSEDQTSAKTMAFCHRSISAMICCNVSVTGFPSSPATAKVVRRGMLDGLNFPLSRSPAESGKSGPAPVDSVRSSGNLYGCVVMLVRARFHDFHFHRHATPVLLAPHLHQRQCDRRPRRGLHRCHVGRAVKRKPSRERPLCS